MTFFIRSFPVLVPHMGLLNELYFLEMCNIRLVHAFMLEGYRDVV